MISIDLSGKTALVTGATGQLGRVIVRRLAQAGADVIVQYQKNESKAGELVEEIRKLGVRGMAAQAEVTSEESVLALRDRAAREFSLPQIVVAAAVIQYQPWLSVLEQPTADYQSQFESCVLHNVNLAKAFVPAMREAGYGRYVGINTELSRLYRTTQSAYASAKSGMDTLLKILAKEVGPSGVTVNQVAPGWMISDRHREEQTDDRDYAANLPLQHRGTDEDIADAVLFLSSDMAQFITGVLLPVCGGAVLV